LIFSNASCVATGKAASAQLICTILKKFHSKKIFITHVHAAHILQTYLHFNNIIDIDFFCSIAKNYDVIAAPDKGAFDFAQSVANSCKKDIVFFS
jgi:phosphoribosylpyrophosphate synthetase